MLTKIPGSVGVYNSVPRVPSGIAVPDPVTSRLIHCG